AIEGEGPGLGVGRGAGRPGAGAAGGSGAPGQAVPAAQPVDRHGRSGLPSCRRGGPTDGAAGGLTPRGKQASAAKPSAAPGWRFPKLLPTWDMQKCGVENELGTGSAGGPPSGRPRYDPSGSQKPRSPCRRPIKPSEVGNGDAAEHRGLSVPV